MLLIEILFAIGVGVWFYKKKKKAKKLQEDMNFLQARLDLQTATYEDVKTLIAKGREKVDELIKKQDELSRDLLFESGKLNAQKQQNEERLIQLEKEQEQKKKEMLDRMRAEYATDAGKIVEELNQAKRSLSEERAKVRAINSARKLAEKEHADRDFHRVCVPIANLNDIEKLKSLALELKNPDVLYKLIWKEYYQALTGEMIDRVVGSDKVSGIYKITYIPDGRCYIGRSVDIAERFRQHIRCGLKASKGTAPFYDILFSLSVENFTFEILQKAKSDELADLEAYYIDFYDSVASGFNTLSGSR